jgi:hypothetical protein
MCVKPWKEAPIPWPNSIAEVESFAEFESF